MTLGAEKPLPRKDNIKINFEEISYECGLDSSDSVYGPAKGSVV
jgi:hypothetical protein